MARPDGTWASCCASTRLAWEAVVAVTALPQVWWRAPHALRAVVGRARSLGCVFGWDCCGVLLVRVMGPDRGAAFCFALVCSAGDPRSAFAYHLARARGGRLRERGAAAREKLA